MSVQIQAKTFSNYDYPDDDGVKLYLYAQQDFTESGGESVIAGNHEQNRTSRIQFDCSIVDKVLTIPAKTVFTTTDSPTPWVKWVAVLVDSNSTILPFLVSDFSLPVTEDSNISWMEIFEFNHTFHPRRPDFLSAEQQYLLFLRRSNSVGDMLKSVYDTNNDGIVDDSENLEGNNASYYLSRENHTGEQAQSTITDLVSDLTLKADLVSGKVPSAQLPSYVDDVLEYANFAAFPGTGETGKIYIAINTGNQYRWSGSIYVDITGGGGGSGIEYGLLGGTEDFFQIPDATGDLVDSILKQGETGVDIITDFTDPTQIVFLKDVNDRIYLGNDYGYIEWWGRNTYSELDLYAIFPNNLWVNQANIYVYSDDFYCETQNYTRYNDGTGNISDCVIQSYSEELIAEGVIDASIINQLDGELSIKLDSTDEYALFRVRLFDQIGATDSEILQILNTNHLTNIPGVYDVFAEQEVLFGNSSSRFYQAVRKDTSRSYFYLDCYADSGNIGTYITSDADASGTYGTSILIESDSLPVAGIEAFAYYSQDVSDTQSIILTEQIHADSYIGVIMVADGDGAKQADILILGETVDRDGVTVHVDGFTFTRRMVTPKTANFDTEFYESRTIYTNEGTASKIDFRLIFAELGVEFQFYVQDADGLRVVAAAGDTIRIGSLVSAAAGNIESTQVGSSITLLAINATEWVATSVVGTWSVT